MTSKKFFGVYLSIPTISQIVNEPACIVINNIYNIIFIAWCNVVQVHNRLQITFVVLVIIRVETIKFLICKTI